MPTTARDYYKEQAMEGRIEKAQWGEFLTNLVKTYHGYEARLEVIGRTFGDQEEAAWLPFTGLSYDPHHDQLFITVGGISGRYPVHLTHRIDAPTLLHVQRTPAGEVSSILVEAEDKTETLMHLRRQPQLGA
jgi:hypothetical protein